MTNKLISLVIIMFILSIGRSYSDDQFIFPKEKPSIFKKVDKKFIKSSFILLVSMIGAGICELLVLMSLSNFLSVILKDDNSLDVIKEGLKVLRFVHQILASSKVRLPLIFHTN